MIDCLSYTGTYRNPARTGHHCRIGRLAARLQGGETGKPNHKKALLLILAIFVINTAVAEGPPKAKVITLLSKDLKESPGREGLMIAVEYPPGSSDPIHRHNAHAFVYVLEGIVVMQVKGGKQVTLTAGQTFYEGPDDIHVVGNFQPELTNSPMVQRCPHRHMHCQSQFHQPLQMMTDNLGVPLTRFRK